MNHSQITDRQTCLALRQVGLAILLTMGLVFAGCGGDDNPAAPGGGGGGGGGTGTMSATIDGTAWTATVSTAINNSSLIGVAGTNVGEDLAIGLGFFDAGVGTYTVGAGATPVLSVSRSTGDSWTAGSGIGSGTVTVSTLTATRIAGTFAFNAAAVPGGAGPAMRVVTAGTFDIAFSSTTP